MFPGIDGFHWTVAHVVFLSLFFAVVVTILTTVVSAVVAHHPGLSQPSRDRVVLEIGLCGVARNRIAAAATNLRAE